MDIRHEIVQYSDTNIPIYIRSASSTEGNISADAHIHEEIEILYVTSGTLTFSFIDKNVVVHEGEILVINSMFPHCSWHSDNTNIVILQFRPEFIINNNLNYYFPYLPLLISGQHASYNLFRIKDNENFQNIASMLIGIDKELKERTIAYEFNIMSLIYNILTILFRHNAINYTTIFDFNNKQNLQKLEPVFKYVENHYNENIRLEEVANLINYSPQHFCRLFKDVTNKTFIDYLNSFRINIAIKMIINSNESIYSIYTKTGFSSFSYFNRTFKKYNKYSPQKYRQVFLDKEKLLKSNSENVDF